MRFKLPKSIDFVLDTLIKNGHNAYIVGGCVRDLLHGVLPSDYDITTSALPYETQALFEHTVATGLKHGTVTVIVDGEMIEVTTFRTESKYSDSRHPESVNFVTDIKDDLSRRDFTINAMCYNHQEGIIDCFGGMADINAAILRAVGNAETRFNEDALRILRLFRFASTLDFAIEQSTFDAAIKCAEKLKNISAERIFTELKKLACGKRPELIYPLLCTDAVADYSLNAAALSSVKALENNADLRMFALLNLSSNDLQKTLNRLKCSNSFKDYCLKMQYLSKNIVAPDKISIKKALNFAEINILNDSLLYYRSILNMDITPYRLLIDEILNTNEPYKISQLEICGKDITALGFEGKDIGKKLEFLLDKVIENPSLNNRQTLINLICN